MPNRYEIKVRQVGVRGREGNAFQQRFEAADDHEAEQFAADVWNDQGFAGMEAGRYRLRLAHVGAKPFMTIG